MERTKTELDAKAWENAGEDAEAAQAAEGGESMEALLAQQAATVEKLAEHKVAWVKVVSVTKDSVLVDVGEKNEGVIPLVEFVEDLAAPKAPAPAAGQRVPVLKVGAREGRLVLSHRKAKAQLGWDLIVKAHAEKQRVRGLVTSTIKGGFIVDVQGVQAFLPASLADLRPVRDPKKLVGTGVRCYVIEVNASRRQLVLSRKAVLEEEAGKRRHKIMDDLRPGEVKIGRVVRASETDGLVVDIGGLEGVVRVPDMAWGKPDMKAFERGTKLKVKVLSKPEAEGSPVQLGVKQLLPNPADALRRRFAPKAVVSGVIKEVGAHGVRFDIDAKTVAFVPAAECDTDIIYKPGDPIKAVVLGVDSAAFEVRASTLRYSEIHDRKRVAQYMKAPPPLTLGQLLQPESDE